jgi:hypothetical protein
MDRHRYRARTCLDSPLKALVAFKESFDRASKTTTHWSLTGASPPETMRRGNVSTHSYGRQDEGRIVARRKRNTEETVQVRTRTHVRA